MALLVYPFAGSIAALAAAAAAVTTSARNRGTPNFKKKGDAPDAMVVPRAVPAVREQ